MYWASGTTSWASRIGIIKDKNKYCKYVDHDFCSLYSVTFNINILNYLIEKPKVNLKTPWKLIHAYNVFIAYYVKDYIKNSDPGLISITEYKVRPKFRYQYNY